LWQGSALAVHCERPAAHQGRTIQEQPAGRYRYRVARDREDGLAFLTAPQLALAKELRRVARDLALGREEERHEHSR
jgi:hypothetical protein